MSPRLSIILISALAVALVVLAVFSMLRISDLNSQVDDLKAQVNEQETATSTLRETGTEDVEAKTEEVETTAKKLSTRLKLIEECLPELQTQINSMSLERYGEEFYVESDSQVSSHCSPVVYGTVVGE